MKKGFVVLTCLMVMAPFASAGLSQFNYGNYEGATVWFNGVGEDNNEAGLAQGWFGAPIDPAGIGDSLVFTPTAFSVESTNGAFVLPKNGQIWFTIDAKAGRDIDSLEIEENGDWSLFGNGTNSTYVEITGAASIIINKIEVGGVEQTINYMHQGLMQYKKTNVAFWDDGKFELVNDGPGAEQWEGELKLNLDQILLDAYDNGEIAVYGKATEVYFTMDNILYAQSENGTYSQIEKKGVGGFVVTIPGVPEPATLAILGLGALLIRRKK